MCQSINQLRFRLGVFCVHHTCLVVYLDAAALHDCRAIALGDDAFQQSAVAQEVFIATHGGNTLHRR